MVEASHIGRTVTIRAADAFYRFVDGWSGKLDDIVSGYGVVLVDDFEVESGFKQFLVPMDQLELSDDQR